MHILNLKTVRIQQFQKNYKYKTPEFEKHKNSANSEIQQKKKEIRIHQQSCILS